MVYYVGQLIFSIVWSCTIANKPFEFIEHAIYVGASDNIPIDHPGIIFRLYSDGLLYYKNEEKYTAYKLNQIKTEMIYCQLLKLIQKMETPYIKKEKNLSIFISESGKPDFYSYHGEISCLRMKKSDKDYLILSPFHPRGNEFFRLIKKAQKMRKNKLVLKKGVDFDNKFNVFPIVLSIYFDLWASF